jgi:DNA-3-methyladenine glycosylase II
LESLKLHPIAIIIPCHRAIGKDGELRGFAGGLETKSELLKVEKRAPRVFKYGEIEIKYLKSRDERLAALIDRIGITEHVITPDLFTALVSSIIGQQISMKAAETVWRRIVEKFGVVTPQNILSVSPEELQSVGISMRKATYIRDAALRIQSGVLNIEALKTMSDEEVCAELSKLCGVGRWTAEMLMIFSLERSDILSYDDLGIRRGLMKLYSLERLERSEFEKYRRLFSPYATVASFYLWASNDIKAGN